MSAAVRVEVVYALPLEQHSVSLECEEGTTVREAIERSGLLSCHAGIDPARVGIWGRRTDPDAAVRDGDRIELHRPLAADPKEVRRRRAGRRGAAAPEK